MFHASRSPVRGTDIGSSLRRHWVEEARLMPLSSRGDYCRIATIELRRMSGFEADFRRLSAKCTGSRLKINARALRKPGKYTRLTCNEAPTGKKDNDESLDIDVSCIMVEGPIDRGLTE